MNSGIYVIENIVNGKKYIGQTINLKRRLYDHKRCLNKGTHHNLYLQREFAKYGEENFNFKILEKCSMNELDIKEIEWINNYDAMNNSKGYNMESGGNKNKIVSEKTRLKKCGNNNPMYGKKLSKAHIESLKIKNRANSKLLDKNDVVDIKERILKGEHRATIAKCYSVATTTIDKIAGGTNWYWVREDLTLKIKEQKEKSIAQRNKDIKDLEKRGIPRVKIAKLVNCTPTTVTRVLGYNGFKTERERYAKIAEDYKKGLSKQEIMSKYNVCSFVYVKAISKEYNKQRQKIKEKAIEMREQGIRVKDIAKELGFARTTISKWTRNLLQSS